MNENTIRKLIPRLALGVAIMVCTACENYLPEAFQEEEFSTALLDDNARTLLIDTLTVPVNASISDTLDSLIADSSIVSPGDVNWNVVMPGDTGYVVLANDGTTSGAAATLFFYDDIVAMVVTEEDGSPVEPTSEHIPLETIAYAPEIRTRLGYDLSGGQDYVVRFVSSVSSFHLVILEGE
ncbi:MAG: hypothetical protein V3U24_11530 [Candidatus Neomarinimicrobiota bacterium]